MNSDARQVAILVSTQLEWGRKIIEGILAYANEAKSWHLWIKPGVVDRFDQLPVDWRCDGVIARVAQPQLAMQLNQSGLPVVNVADSPVAGFSAPSVVTDDVVGTQMAVDYFVERGFKSLAFVGPIDMFNPVAYARAFKAAVDAAGIPYTFFPVKQEGLEERPALIEWLRSLPKPVGILAWGHGHARNLVDCCVVAGIVVPHDVAILSGSNDDLLCNACYPTLSGVLAPLQQIGYRSAQLLDQMMQGRVVSHEPLFLPPTGIRERLSTDTLAVEDSQLVKVVAFMREHAFDSITVEDVLRAVPMGRSTLDRRFYKAFGRSPSDEIRRLRINKARQLLAETDLQMQDIAEVCGFSSYNYLSHTFKQVAGMPPRDYRKKMRSS